MFGHGACCCASLTRYLQQLKTCLKARIRDWSPCITHVRYLIVKVAYGPALCHHPGGRSLEAYGARPVKTSDSTTYS